MNRRIAALLLALSLLLQAVPAWGADGDSTLSSEPIAATTVWTVRFVSDEEQGPKTRFYSASEGAILGALPEAPEREGMAFLGWFAPESGLPVGPDTPVSGDMTLVARYVLLEVEDLGEPTGRSGDADADGAFSWTEYRSGDTLALAVSPAGESRARELTVFLTGLPEDCEAAVRLASAKEDDVLAFLEISGRDGSGAEWTLAEPVKVRVAGTAVANAVAAGLTLSVARVLENGAEEAMALEVSGGALSFSAEALGRFALRGRLDLQEDWSWERLATSVRAPQLLSAKGTLDLNATPRTGGGEFSVQIAGPMPRGTEVSAVETQPGIEGEEVLWAADITLIHYDTPIQPQWGALDVTLSSDAIAAAIGRGASLRVYHVGAEGPEELDASTLAVGEDTVSFPAESFSEYILAASEDFEERTIGTEDGRVTIEGPMPAHASFTAEEADADIVEEALLSWDITLYNYQTAIQPREPLTVTLRDEAIAAAIAEEKELEVWHIGEDGSVEPVEGVVAEGDAVSFIATGFSVYAIVPAPERIPSSGMNLLESLEEIAENADRGLYMFHPSGYYFTNQGYTVSGSRTGILKTAKQGAGDPVGSSGAALYYFEPVGDSGNQYRVYCWNADNSAKQYIRQSANSLSFTDEAGASVFTVSQFPNQPGTFRFLGSDGYYWNMQGGDNGKGFAAYNSATDLNARICVGYYSTMEDDPYGFDGKTWGIVYYEDGVRAAALTEEAQSEKILAARELLVRPDVITNSGELLVSRSSDIVEWTFHSVREDYYSVTTEIGGAAKYLTIRNGAVYLADEPDAGGMSALQMVPGVGANAGKIRLSAGGAALSLPGGNAASGFGTGDMLGDTCWLTLTERSSLLTDDDFTVYTARKISVSDPTVTTGSQVILYTRVWNEETLRYEFYAVDYNGTLVRVWESGDVIQWVGSLVNTALWDFTEYFYEDSNTPNYYYDLQNDFSGQYIAPMQGEGQILSGSPVGVNLDGRRMLSDLSSIVAWDDASYTYSGLKIENGRVVACPTDEAQDFYFAIVSGAGSGGVPEGLTTVGTIDNNVHGISMKIVDFNNPIVQNRDSVQTALLGRDSNRAGLVSTDLQGGYPMAVNGSLATLFGSATSVNHLFLQSIYNESGYFEFDSTQNAAVLNGGRFTVYDQLVTIGTNSPSLNHGQFMPYNSLINPTTGQPWPYSTTHYNTTNTTNGPLSDTNPRKGEKMLEIPLSKADYFFGMEMEASFTQTPNGLDAWGHDIIFEFSGDDDFWLYVDGELVLDLGGVHSAMTGSINFRTGEVRSSRGNSTIYALFKEHWESRGMSAAEVAAKLEETFVAKTREDGTTQYVFRDYTTHTMKMFFMERGAGSSNLHMRFNLSSVKPGTVLLSKKVSGAGEGLLAEFPYQFLYKQRNDQGDWETRALSQDEENVLVRYKDTDKAVHYEESLTIDGVTYEHVFLLSPGEIAEITMPDADTLYSIVECGVDTAIFAPVSVNGDALQGALPAGAAQDTTRRDYGLDFVPVKDRSRVEYDNAVKPEALRTLSFTKKLFREDGVTALSRAEDPTLFAFRLYLGSEFASDSQLPLANMAEYHVRDEQGRYCVWDKASGSFSPTEYTDLSAMSAETLRKATFTTSINGAITYIPVDYTVELRGVLAGTKFRVEERDSEIPDGYSLKRYQLRRTPSSAAEEASSGVIGPGEDPNVEIDNLRGWGLRVHKVWSDADYMEGHDTIRFAVFKSASGNMNMVQGTLREMPSGETSLYWYFPQLDPGASFTDYQVCEVNDAGQIVNSITVSATPKGKETAAFTYAVSTQVEQEQTGNVRVFTITNSRPGISVIKTDEDGTPLEGAVFSLRDASGAAVGKGSFTSDETGFVTKVYLDEDGTYTLTEEQSPSGYLGLAGPITLIRENGQTTVLLDGESYPIFELDASGEATLTVRNRPFTLQAVKVRAEDRTPLAGVHFALHRQVALTGGGVGRFYLPEEGYEDLVTDADGAIPRITADLAPGTYYLVEKEPLSGFLPLTADVLFTVGATGGVTLGAEQPEGVALTVEEGEYTKYTITVPNRAYSEAKLTVRKVVENATGADLAGLTSFNFSVTLFKPDGLTPWLYDLNGFSGGHATFALTHGQEKEMYVPVGAVAVVTETANDNYTTSCQVGSEDAQSGYTCRASVDANTAVTFTNTRRTVDVTVNKKLVDPLTAAGDFAFTAVLTDQGRDITGEVEGLGSFTLSAVSSAASRKFLRLPYGAELTVTEQLTADQAACYTAEYNRADGRFTVGPVNNITVTNTRRTVPLTVTKTLEDPDLGAAAVFPFTVTLANAEGAPVAQYDLTKQITTDAAGEASFTLETTHGLTASTTLTVPYGAAVTIAEGSVERPYQTTVNREDGVSWSSQSLTGEGTVAFVNTYAPGTAQLTVTKTVGGIMGDITQSFVFTIALEGGAQGDEIPCEGARTEALVLDAEGKAEFTLRHGESVALTLPSGAGVTITEAHGSYTMTVPQSAPANMEDYSLVADGVTFTLAGDAALDVRNDLEAVVPTGTDWRVAPYILLLAAGLLLAVPAVRKKRRG